MTSGLFYQVAQALAKNQLTLPALPDVAMSIRHAVADPDTGVADVASLVSGDPALSVYLLHVANSPAFRGVASLDTILAAVSRLGLNTSRNLVFSYSIRSLFHAKRFGATKQLGWIWQRSRRIAAMCATLAGSSRNLQADQALMAGLMLDIGALPIIQILEQRGTLPSDEASFWQLLDDAADRVGTLMLKAWDFDEHLLEVTRCRRHWDRDHSKPVDYADLALIADALLYPPSIPGDLDTWFTALTCRRRLALDGLSLTQHQLTDDLTEAFEHMQACLS